jgi:hypothetical protein
LSEECLDFVIPEANGTHHPDIQGVISVIRFASGGAAFIFYGAKIEMATTVLDFSCLQ